MDRLVPKSLISGMRTLWGQRVPLCTASVAASLSVEEKARTKKAVIRSRRDASDVDGKPDRRSSRERAGQTALVEVIRFQTRRLLLPTLRYTAAVERVNVSFVRSS